MPLRNVQPKGESSLRQKSPVQISYPCEQKQYPRVIPVMTWTVPDLFDLDTAKNGYCKNCEGSTQWVQPPSAVKQPFSKIFWEHTCWHPSSLSYIPEVWKLFEKFLLKKKKKKKKKLGSEPSKIDRRNSNCCGNWHFNLQITHIDKVFLFGPEDG